MRDDDKVSELIVDSLMKALVEEEGLPREQVERGVQRFLESLRQETKLTQASRLLRGEGRNGGDKTR